jgi:hypothetical protein
MYNSQKFVTNTFTTNNRGGYLLAFFFATVSPLTCLIPGVTNHLNINLNQYVL